MRAKLVLTKFEGSIAEDSRLKTLDAGGLTIGRGAENNWVLPDSTQDISRRHCTIDFKDGAYSVTDLSTNGVFINDARKPLGKGRSEILHDGDRLSLGTRGRFQIAIDIVANGQSDEVARSGMHRISDPREPTTIRPNVAEQAGAGGEGVRLDREPLPPARDAIPSSIDTPPAARESRSVLPEDWNLLGELRKEEARQSESEDPARSFDLNNPAPIHEPFTPMAVKSAQIPDDWFPGGIGQRSHDSDSTGAPAATNTVSRQKSEALAAPGATISAPDLVSRFVQSCGLEPWPMGEREAQHFMSQLGTVFRELVAGLREALMARATIKGGFPLERTTLSASNNNPFKFSVSAEEALEAVLGRRSRGYLPAVAAVKEGFRDLNAHQLATIAGMQVALDTLLDDLNPERLKKNLEAKRTLSSLLPGARELSYRKLYEEVYHRVAEETKDKFHNRYAQAFADAYKEESRKA